MRIGPRIGFVAAVGVACVAVSLPLRLDAQRGGMFLGSADDPAIAYATAPLDNVVDELNRRLESGAATLTFDGRSGYLQSVIDALQLPVDSQLLLFSKGSLQRRQIEPSNPRAVFFDDGVALGWVRDGDLLEVAVQDRRAGLVFYSLEQRPAERPAFKREFRCLGCHMTGDTLGVPGLLMFSTTPATSDRAARAVATDHRTAVAERWGGWFVTGRSGGARHRGNQVQGFAASPDGVASVAGLFDPEGFRATASDIAALLTYSHQVHMANLLTRAAWEARAADPSLRPGAPASPEQTQALEALMNGIAEEVVDYMLFVDEAPLPNPIAGDSGFAERMSARGPRDSRGRSLYELDLNRRLLKYPCSYLVYSPAFDALPLLIKAPIYKRMWDVLGGAVRDPRYSVLSLADRQAIVEILKDTRPDLPAFFTTVTR